MLITELLLLLPLFIVLSSNLRLSLLFTLYLADVKSVAWSR